MPRRTASRMVENAVRRLGFSRVVGVDEVGRGCLAGPVVVAAVVLHPGRPIKGVRDSKLLTPAARERLYTEITERADAWTVASAAPEEVDDPQRPPSLTRRDAESRQRPGSATRFRLGRRFSGFPTCFSLNVGSSGEIGGARPSRPRRLSPKSLVTARCWSCTPVTLDTDLTVTKGMRRPSISMPSRDSGGPRCIGCHSVLRPGLIGSNPQVARRGLETEGG